MCHMPRPEGWQLKTANTFRYVTYPTRALRGQIRKSSFNHMHRDYNERLRTMSTYSRIAYLVRQHAPCSA